jgi:Lon protease-like protein
MKPSTDTTLIVDDPVSVQQQEPQADTTDSQATSTVVGRPEDILPDVVIALPLNQRPVFPTMMLPLVIPAGRLAIAVRHAIQHQGGAIGFFMTRTVISEGSAFTVQDLEPMGCVARVVKHQEVDGGNLQIFAQVLARFRITAVEREEPVVMVRGIALRTQVDTSDPHIRACAMAIVASLKDLVQHNPVFADEIRLVLSNFNNIDGPGRLADIAASLTTAKREEIQQILETIDIVPRMERVLVLLAKEAQLSQLRSKITQQIEGKVSEHQRRFFLTEQLKAIKQELGLESDEKSLDIKKFADILAAKGAHMGAEVKQVMEEEVRKLSLLDPCRERIWRGAYPARVARRSALGGDHRGRPRSRHACVQGARPGPLRPGGHQGAHRRILRRPPPQGRPQRRHHRPGRPTGHRQDLNRCSRSRATSAASSSASRSGACATRPRSRAIAAPTSAPCRASWCRRYGAAAA